MQGQENRKADILGIESALSNEAAELLLDEDAQVVKYYIYIFKKAEENYIMALTVLRKKGIYRIAVSCNGVKQRINWPKRTRSQPNCKVYTSIGRDF